MYEPNSSNTKSLKMNWTWTEKKIEQCETISQPITQRRVDREQKPETRILNGKNMK
jgi:hypothetical protein